MIIECERGNFLADSADVSGRRLENKGPGGSSQQKVNWRIDQRTTKLINAAMSSSPVMMARMVVGY